MDPTDVERLIDDAAQFFNAHKQEMAHEGAAFRRNQKRNQTLQKWARLQAQGVADQWVAAMEAATLNQGENYDEELCDIAADYIVGGEPVPPILRRYIRKVLHRSVPFELKRKRRGERRDHDTIVRDIFIAARVKLLKEKYYIPPRSNDTDKYSGCKIVSEALALVTVKGSPMAISPAAVADAWRKYGASVRAA